MTERYIYTAMTKQYIYSGGTRRTVHRIRPELMSMQDFAKVYRGLMLAGEASERCRVATQAAERAGREFTPVYWYYPKDGSLPVLTMWDVNEPQPEAKSWWNDPRIFNPNKTLKR